MYFNLQLKVYTRPGLLQIMLSTGTEKGAESSVVTLLSSTSR